MKRGNLLLSKRVYDTYTVNAAIVSKSRINVYVYIEFIT